MRWSLLPALLALAAGGPVSAQGSPLRAYRGDRDGSHVLVVTHRSGLLSFLGHEHAIVAGEWTAQACVPRAGVAGAHASFAVPTRSLVIDAPIGRALAGLGKGPSESDVRSIQAKMLDAEHLDAARYPELRLESTRITETGPEKLDVQARLTIHGTTREVRFPALLERLEGDALRLTGSFSVLQSDYGIRPTTVAGVVRVVDRVDLRFALRLAPTGGACS
jgi:hypothetical protein